jgi:hypothetical protein
MSPPNDYYHPSRKSQLSSPVFAEGLPNPSGNGANEPRSFQCLFWAAATILFPERGAISLRFEQIVALFAPQETIQLRSSFLN